MTHILDHYFCKYIREKSKGDPNEAFRLLVDAIGHGNGEYVIDLCETLGHKNNMILAVKEILK